MEGDTVVPLGDVMRFAEDRHLRAFREHISSAFAKGKSLYPTRRKHGRSGYDMTTELCVLWLEVEGLLRPER